MSKISNSRIFKDIGCFLQFIWIPKIFLKIFWGNNQVAFRFLSRHFSWLKKNHNYIFWKVTQIIEDWLMLDDKFLVMVTMRGYYEVLEGKLLVTGELEDYGTIRKVSTSKEMVWYTSWIPYLWNMNQLLKQWKENLDLLH